MIVVAVERKKKPKDLVVNGQFLKLENFRWWKIVSFLNLGKKMW